MTNAERTGTVLVVLAVVFFALGLKFLTHVDAPAAKPNRIPLVDTQFLDTATFRKSYAELIREKADLSDFDCYACHEKGKPPVLRFDAQHNLIVPKEHSDIVMKHGTHDRNNNCFNCHDEQNLELLQTRDGRQIKLAESPPLCGSCHGPTYRDWEAGAHGRTGGYWDPDRRPYENARSAWTATTPTTPKSRPANRRPARISSILWPRSPRKPRTDMPSPTSNSHENEGQSADGLSRRSFLRSSAVCWPPAWRPWPRAWPRCAI